MNAAKKEAAEQMENIDLVIQKDQTVGFFAQGDGRETYVELTYLGEGKGAFDLYKAAIGEPGQLRGELVALTRCGGDRHRETVGESARHDAFVAVRGQTRQRAGDAVDSFLRVEEEVA